MMLRAPLRAAAVGGVSGALFVALTLEESVRTMSDARRDVYVRTWAGSLLRVLRLDMVMTPRPPEADRAMAPRAEGGKSAPLLAVGNHRSTLDILMMLHLFGGHMLARGDMARWPGMGPLARRAGTLFVDRDNPLSGAAAVRRMRERLQRGITVGVFPEGSTFDGDEVRPFQPGAFLAIATERGMVVPVGFAYERAESHFGDEPFLDHIRRLAAMPRIRVGVAVGAPFSTAGSKAAHIARDARDRVQELVTEARARVTRVTAVP